jgi:hypothetical protein
MCDTGVGGGIGCVDFKSYDAVSDELQDDDNHFTDYRANTCPSHACADVL